MPSKTRHHKINPVFEVNQELQSLVNRLPTTVPFGPALQDLDGVSLNDSVVCHRIRNSFIVPEDYNEEALHIKAVRSMLTHDQIGHEFNMFAFKPEVRATLYEAQSKLRDWYTGFRPTYHFRPPSGESALSNRGLTDVWYKLSDPIHWEITSDALPYCQAIVYTNRWLRKVVKDHFNLRSPTGIDPRVQKARWYQEWKDKKVGSAGFYVVGKMFASLCTINHCARIVSIPKNAKSRRVIGMFPFWNMVAQLSLMQDMRQTLKKRLGFDLNSRADLHKTLLPHRKFATIDLKNASNSVWSGVVDFLFPKSLTRHFNVLVDRHFEFDLGEGTEYGYFNMFAPMGCGITFDVMTLMLLSVTRTLDSAASVFGDDIIIRQPFVGRLYSCLSALGLEVNIEKSFPEGSFSESCGGFYNHSSHEYIVSFDFPYCESRTAAFAAVNKLQEIVNRAQVSDTLLRVLRVSVSRLHEVLERFAVCSPSRYLPSGYIAAEDTYTRKRSVMVRVLEEMWQRRIDIATVTEVTAVGKEPLEGVPTTACYLLRGGPYQPPTELETKTVLCDSWSLAPLAGIQLVSVL